MIDLALFHPSRRNEIRCRYEASLLLFSTTRTEALNKSLSVTWDHTQQKGSTQAPNYRRTISGQYVFLSARGVDIR